MTLSTEVYGPLRDPAPLDCRIEREGPGVLILRLIRICKQDLGISESFFDLPV